ncbi:MAG: hypothetical protein ABJ004_02015 [Cyclobacteriaceae bacterium]
MKYLIPILSIIIITSCSKSAQIDSTEYVAELKINQIFFYGDTIKFDPPQTLRVKPNSEEITKIELGNGSDFGVIYYVSEMKTGSKTELMHNAAFYEKVGDSWGNLNDKDHREKLTLNEEKDWGIGIGDCVEQYLKVDFTYKVTEL